MKVNLTKTELSEIEGFLKTFDTEIAALNNAAERSTVAHQRLGETEKEIGSFPSIEEMTDKQLLSRMIARERKVLLEQFALQMEESVVADKKKAAQLAAEAMELFRRFVGKSLEGAAKTAFVDLLPAQLRQDEHFAFDAWNRSAVRREVGAFLNPPRIEIYSDAFSISEETQRRAHLLRRLAAGEQVPIPQLAEA